VNLCLYLYIPSRPLTPHPFPTRRSSDLSTRTRFRHIFGGFLAISAGCVLNRVLCSPQSGGLRHGHAQEIHHHHLRSPSRKMPLRSEEHTSELQSRGHIVCRLLLEKKNYD